MTPTPDPALLGAERLQCNVASADRLYFRNGVVKSTLVLWGFGGLRR